MASSSSAVLASAASTARSRRAAVAGYFYPSDPEALRSLLQSYRPDPRGKLAPASAVIVPHGKYGWSGAVTGGVFGRVDVPRRCIVLGPSHTGQAGGWSLMAAGTYGTPLGEVAIDEELAGAIQARCPFVGVDEAAHYGEHAIEVLIPFLQHFGPPDLRLTPLVCGSVDPVQRVQLAASLADLVRRSPEPVLLIASSDLTHFEPADRTDACDRILIDRMSALDPEGLLRLAREHRTRMCGDDAVACILQAASLLGASHGTLTGRTTSAAGGGDPGSTIGYAGIIIT